MLLTYKTTEMTFPYYFVHKRWLDPWLCRPLAIGLIARLAIPKSSTSIYISLFNKNGNNCKDVSRMTYNYFCQSGSISTLDSIRGWVALVSGIWR